MLGWRLITGVDFNLRRFELRRGISDSRIDMFRCDIFGGNRLSSGAVEGRAGLLGTIADIKPMRAFSGGLETVGENHSNNLPGLLYSVRRKRLYFFKRKGDHREEFA